MSTTGSAVFWFRPTTFRLYRYSNEGRPSGSGRNSYVSSNYSNFLSQNSQRKLPRSSLPRRKRNRRLRPPRGDLRPSQTTPLSSSSPSSPILGATLHSRATLSRWRQRRFPGSRGGRGKPTRKFHASFSHSRNSTLGDAIEGLKLRSSMRDNPRARLLADVVVVEWTEMIPMDDWEKRIFFHDI